MSQNFDDLDPYAKTILLKNPISDAGQWNIFQNLIEKHGIIPQTCYPHTYASKSTESLNMILNHKLKYAKLKNLNHEDVMKDIYKTLEYYLGKMPGNFTWMYKIQGNTHTIANINPKTFYFCYILPTIEHFPNYISLIHDPRNEYYKYYESDLLISSLTHYNIPIEELTGYARDALMLDYPVFCTCDIHKYCFASQQECFVSNVDDTMMTLDKKERLEMHDSSPNHAIVLEGFTHNHNWKFENSWGCSYYYAEHDWVKNFVFQIVVPKHIVKNLRTKTNVKKYSVHDPFGRIQSKTKFRHCFRSM